MTFLDTQLTWVENSANHARHNNDNHWQHLQVAGKDGGGLGVVETPGREGPLDNDLERHKCEFFQK